MPSRLCRTKRPGLPPRTHARILELRVTVPWLGLRKISAALGLSLAEVRAAVAVAPQRTLRTAARCPECGEKLTVLPCVACRCRPRQRSA